MNLPLREALELEAAFNTFRNTPGLRMKSLGVFRSAVIAKSLENALATPKATIKTKFEELSAIEKAQNPDASMLTKERADDMMKFMEDIGRESVELNHFTPIALSQIDLDAYPMDKSAGNNTPDPFTALKIITGILITEHEPDTK